MKKQKSRFKPTYKELKPQKAEQVSGRLNRFKPTYKELKHFPSGCGRRCDSGFKPTYKELKLLFISSPPGANHYDSSLPIRN